MPNLQEVTLVGIHHKDDNNSYIFSFVAPCEVTGTRVDGSNRIVKKIFFAHCVVLPDAGIVKVVYNPTVNLQNVVGVRKGRNYDWSPISYEFFLKLKQYIGEHSIVTQSWTSKALYSMAVEASDHNNPQIHEISVGAMGSISSVAHELLMSAGLDPHHDQAMFTRFAEDIQQSYEAQLVEKYGVGKGESFVLFRQRSDGVTHVIDVESREAGAREGAGLRTGPAAQVIRRSREDGVAMLGILYRRNNTNYKFNVELTSNAYLIRSANAFIEEEVVNFVIDKLNEYRDKIQATTVHTRADEQGDTSSTT